MIVVFHTNVDCKYGAWKFPKEVSCRPQIGDLVETNDKVLVVCSVTHCYFEQDRKPYLKVELTQRSWSI